MNVRSISYSPAGPLGNRRNRGQVSTKKVIQDELDNIQNSPDKRESATTLLEFVKNFNEPGQQTLNKRVEEINKNLSAAQPLAKAMRDDSGIFSTDIDELDVTKPENQNTLFPILVQYIALQESGKDTTSKEKVDEF